MCARRLLNTAQFICNREHRICTDDWNVVWHCQFGSPKSHPTILPGLNGSTPTHPEQGVFRHRHRCEAWTWSGRWPAPQRPSRGAPVCDRVSSPTSRRLRQPSSRESRPDHPARRLLPGGFPGSSPSRGRPRGSRGDELSDLGCWLVQLYPTS